MLIWTARHVAGRAISKAGDSVKMDAHIARKALDNYVEKARESNVSSVSLEKRQQFLERLVELVGNDSFSPAMYRIAVARVVPEFSRGPDAMLYKATAREFSHHLADAEGGKVAIADTDSARAPEVEIEAPPSLEQLLDEAAGRAWYVSHLGRLERQVRDLRNLERYLHTLRERGIGTRLVERQGRLLGGLLYLLATHHGNSLAYRAGVSAMLNMLSTDAKQQRIFVEIAREFYHFWLQDPDAPRGSSEAGGSGRAVSTARQ